MIYFLRHQKTFNNKFEVISGQTDSPILLEDIYVEKDFITKGIEIIYTSPSKRCLDTLKYIPNLTVTPRIDTRLLERNMGDFENGSRKELYEKYPEYFRIINNKILFRFQCTPPNGELFSEFKERVDSFCREMIFPDKRQNIMICSHNQTLKMIYFILKGEQPSEKIWEKVCFPNGEIVTYMMDSKKSNIKIGRAKI